MGKERTEPKMNTSKLAEYAARTTKKNKILSLTKIPTNLLPLLNILPLPLIPCNPLYKAIAHRRDSNAIIGIQNTNRRWGTLTGTQKGTPGTMCVRTTGRGEEC